MGIDGQWILSAVGAAGGAFLANFMNVDFKRWREGGSLAAALAGELRAHEFDWETISLTVEAVNDLGSRGYTFRAPTREKRADRMYEASVAQLGLLGPALVTKVIRAYARASDCRQAYMHLETQLSGLEATKISDACRPVQTALREARRAAEDAVEDLETRSLQGFTSWYVGRGR